MAGIFGPEPYAPSRPLIVYLSHLQKNRSLVEVDRVCSPDGYCATTARVAPTPLGARTVVRAALGSVAIWGLVRLGGDLLRG